MKVINAVPGIITRGLFLDARFCIFYFESLRPSFCTAGYFARKFKNQKDKILLNK